MSLEQHLEEQLGMNVSDAILHWEKLIDAFEAQPHTSHITPAHEELLKWEKAIRFAPNLLFELGMRIDFNHGVFVDMVENKSNPQQKAFIQQIESKIELFPLLCLWRDQYGALNHTAYGGSVEDWKFLISRCASKVSQLVTKESEGGPSVVEVFSLPFYIVSDSV